MRVLVPLDGSRLADGILAHARRVLLRESSEIHLLRVLADDDDEPLARRHLEECCELLESTGETVSVHVRRGPPAEEILAAVEEIDADMVTMATHGRSGVARWVRGSVAERILRESPVPVYLANPSGILRPSDKIRFGRILVPLDGSKLSAKILPTVTALAADSEAQVILLHADSPAHGAHPVPEVAIRKAQERGEAALKVEADRLRQAGVDVSVLGVYGDAASEILDSIARFDVELVAMTSHGRTGLSRWRFGSVADKVLRECRCPLLVWRPRQKKPS